MNIYTFILKKNTKTIDNQGYFNFKIEPHFYFSMTKSLKFDTSNLKFQIGYSLTSKGDLKKKLEYAFELYDSDGNGYLDHKEIRDVITGMLDLLGADKKSNNAFQLAEECIKQLDASNDGRVSKGII